MSKVFIDTNILVYCTDKYDIKKRDICRAHIKTLRNNLRGVISTQVMQEFYLVATKKLNTDPLVAKSILHSFENFEIVVITPEIINDAIDCSILNRLSFWDSLIISAAQYAKCEQLLTEDLNHGQIIQGLRIVNPLKDDSILS